jgi:hypothetical protein
MHTQWLFFELHPLSSKGVTASYLVSRLTSRHGESSLARDDPVFDPGLVDAGKGGMAFELVVYDWSRGEEEKGR